jgi:hypothetical protein
LNTVLWLEKLLLWEGTGKRNGKRALEKPCRLKIQDQWPQERTETKKKK